MLAACNVDIDTLREEMERHLDETLAGINIKTQGQTQPTTSFQRVLQRAVIHTQSSGRDVATGANVLIALFAERESHAVWALQQQEMTRLDAVTYISHGIAKNPNFTSGKVDAEGVDMAQDEGGTSQDALAAYAVDPRA